MAWRLHDITAPIAKARVQEALGAGAPADPDATSKRIVAQGEVIAPVGTGQPARPSISTDEAKLNKTERAFLEYLRYTAQVKCLHVMSVTLKLAFDCRLTPDFSYYSEGGQLTFIDVKGWQREDALIKMKVAARTFPEWRFVIVKRIKGAWKFEEIKP